MRDLWWTPVCWPLVGCEFAANRPRFTVHATVPRTPQIHDLGCNRNGWGLLATAVRLSGLFSHLIADLNRPHPTPPAYGCSEDGCHALSYELGWRQLADPARTASRAVLGQLGDKVLSAVKYVARGDTFDNPAFPTQGSER